MNTRRLFQQLRPRASCDQTNSSMTKSMGHNSPGGELITIIPSSEIHKNATPIPCLSAQQRYRIHESSVESTELRLPVLGCLCFRGRINREAKENESFEGELVVPVNFLLFSGASIGVAADA
jgi:hypothetical protein